MGCGTSVHYPEPLDAYVRRLFEAVSDNDPGLIKAICKRTNNEALRGTRSNQNALTLAVSTNKTKAVSMLLRMGFDPNKKDKNGDTALVVACRDGNNDLVQLLVDSGADMFVRGGDGMSPLQLACHSNYVETAFGLLSMMQQVTERARKANRLHKLPPDHTLDVAIDITDPSGRTPLHWCCMEGMEQMARNLLEFGATVNAQTRDGYTPLMLACENGFQNLVELLLSTGSCDLLLREYDRKFQAVHFAVEKNLPSILEVLLQAGAHPDSIMPLDEETLLHHCIYTKQPACAIKLVDAGADIRRTNADMLDPLHAICRASSLPQDPVESSQFAYLVRKLLSLGMDPNHEVPLFHACYNGHEKVALVLLEHGADPNTEEPESRMSALQAAMSMKLYDATADLLARGASSEHMDADGHSVMDVAIQTEDSNIVLILTTPRENLPPGLLNRSLRISEDCPEVPGKSHDTGPPSPQHGPGGSGLSRRDRRSSTSALPFSQAALKLASSPHGHSPGTHKGGVNAGEGPQSGTPRGRRRSHAGGLSVSVPDFSRGPPFEEEEEFSSEGHSPIRFAGVAPFPDNPPLILSEKQHQGPTAAQIKQMRMSQPVFHPPFDALETVTRARQSSLLQQHQHRQPNSQESPVDVVVSPKRASFA